MVNSRNESSNSTSSSLIPLTTACLNLNDGINTAINMLDDTAEGFLVIFDFAKREQKLFNFT